MDTNESDEHLTPRPYSLSEIEWAMCFVAARAAMEAVVSPLYQNYVLANADILQRSTGMSLVYPRMSEAIEQVDVGRTMFRVLIEASKLVRHFGPRPVRIPPLDGDIIAPEGSNLAILRYDVAPHSRMFV
jgi:hypothetical protein